MENLIFRFLFVVLLLSGSELNGQCNPVIINNSLELTGEGEGDNNVLSNVCFNDYRLFFTVNFEYRALLQDEVATLTFSYNTLAFEHIDGINVTGSNVTNVTETQDMNDPERNIMTIELELPTDLSGNVFDVFIFISGRAPDPHPSYVVLEEEFIIAELKFNNTVCQTKDILVIPEVVPYSNYLTVPNFSATTPLSTQDFFIDNLKPVIFNVENMIVDVDWTDNVTSGIRRTCYMQPGAEITVRSGVTLHLKDYNFIPCGQLWQSNFWDSMILEPGATLILENCIFRGGMKGIKAESGSSISLESCTFKFFESFSTTEYAAIELNGSVSVEKFDNNIFDLCDVGVRVLNGQDIDLSASSLDNSNYFLHGVLKGIDMLGSEATIKNNRFVSTLPITSRITKGLLHVENNEIDYFNWGLFANGGDVIITRNKFGQGLSMTPNGTGDMPRFGKRAIILSLPNGADIEDNTIRAEKIGIQTSFVLNENSEIWDNSIEVVATEPNAYGINTFFAANHRLENNYIYGSGHQASIRVGSLHGCEVVDNTTQATSTGNGIVISGGSGNTVEQNLISNNPLNGILNYSSEGNTYDDNDIYALYQGLSIEPASGREQWITCNNFLNGGTDLNIESVIGIQPHHQNLTRVSGSAARAPGLSAFDIQASRFEYDQTQPANGNLQLFVDPNNDGGLFDPQNGPSLNELPCSNNVGYDGIMTPEEFSEAIASLDADDYWMQLRLLLGRYYATHGPNSRPDCVPECRLTELATQEAILRQAMSGTEGLSSSNTETNVKSIAMSQYNQLSGEGENTISTFPPCGDIVLEPLYESTYTKIVKYIATEKLSNTDISELRVVADYCPQEYGEVVEWAKGLLHTQAYYDYENNDCDSSEIDQRNIVEIPKDWNITLFPSPASDIVQVGMGDADYDTVDITVTDMKGRQVSHQHYGSDAVISIPLVGIANGMYLMTITVDSRETITKKFTVQH